MKTLFCATVTKTTAASPLGLHLWAPPQAGRVLLVRLDDHGLFSGKLKAGLEIVRINDTPVAADMTVADVQALLAQLVGRVTLWAAAPQPVATSSSHTRVETTPQARPSPPPSVVDLSDHDSLDSLSLHDDDEDHQVCDDMDFSYYYGEPDKRPHRVGSLFDAVVDFLF